MRTTFPKTAACLAFTVIAAFAQSKPAFEVATVKPAAPLDPAKVMAAMRGGGTMPVGAHIDASRAEYNYMDLKSLIASAYGVKPYQITAPDWMGTTRFDIVAKIPAGASKNDVPKMLQSLLEDRFKLTTHRVNEEHPVLALVVSKSGPKMKKSTEIPVAIDENAPLKPGEIKMEGPNGPIRMTLNPATGSAVVDMGVQGKMSYKMNAATQSMHLDLSMMTMSGFADMLTQLFTQIGGGSGRQIVDMTNIKGNYEASLEISLADLIAIARSSGMVGAQGGPDAGNPGNGLIVAPDPTGASSSLTEAVQSLGLKLEARKAMVDQFIVDHAEKTPTEN